LKFGLKKLYRLCASGSKEQRPPKNLIADLSSKLPVVSFVFADGYTFFTKLIENPQAYEFDNGDTPCCSFGRYRPTLSCVAATKLCPDRTKYLFWDEYHPNDAANLVIA